MSLNSFYDLEIFLIFSSLRLEDECAKKNVHTENLSMLSYFTSQLLMNITVA